MSSSSSSTIANINERDKCGETVLLRAVLDGDKSEVKRLLAAGADPNLHASHHGDTPLYHAVTQNVQLVQLLLDHGADVNVVDKSGSTILHAASRVGRVEIVECLLFRGAAVGVKNKFEETALRAAVVNGNISIVEILAAFDADIGDEVRGVSLLMSAVRRNVGIEIVRALLWLNANATNLDAFGQSVLTYAKGETKQLLEDFINKPSDERKQLRDEILNRTRARLAIRLMRVVQPEIIGICLAFAPLDLPPYVLLWIIDFLPNYYDRLSHHKKIELITSVRNSIWKLKL